MINREDSALIARERQNRAPVNSPAQSTAAKPANAKSERQDSPKKPPLRAGKVGK